MTTATVHAFADRLVADYERRGLDERPEVFPKHPGAESFGDWLRLPGRHHTRLTPLACGTTSPTPTCPG